MKKIILALSLCFTSLVAIPVQDFMDKVVIADKEQYDRIFVLCRVMEELSVEDRTIIYVFLDQLDEDRDVSENDSEVCHECAAGEICTDSK